MSATIPQSVRAFFAENRISLALSDATNDDDPLILVNDAFCDLTGYTREEALGRSARFLQGEGTRKAHRDHIRGDFAGNRDSFVLIRNYHKSGVAFDNFLSVFTIFDDDETPVFRIGSHFAMPKNDRAKSFETHIAILRDGLEKINTSGDIPGTRQIDTVPLKSMNSQTLLLARLENVRAA